MRTDRFRMLGHIGRAYARHPGLLAMSMGGTLLASTAVLLAPVYVKRFFDALTAGAPTSAFLPIIGGAAALKFAEWLFGRVKVVAGNLIRPKVGAEIEAEIFGKAIGQSAQFFADTFSGALTKKVFRFGNGVRTLEMELQSILFPIAINVVGTAIALYFIRPFLAPAFIVGIGGIGLISHAVGGPKRKADKAAAKADTERGGIASDIFGNILTVKLFAQGSVETQKIANAGSTWARLKSRANNRGALISSVFLLCSLIVEIAVLAYCAYAVPAGELTIGDVAMLQTYILLALSTVRNLEASLRGLDECFADLDEGWKLMEQPHEIADAPDAKLLQVASGAITLRSVTFGYNPKRPVLKGFSLDVTPGEKIALVGPSGAGKSTITKLLLRLVDPTKGTVRIDGQNIAKATQDSLRRAVSLVPQDPVLFHRSLMDNIRYGRPEATDDEVIEASKRARCHDFISALPEGYASLVGERGVKLSGGERQRVAIARAILKNSPILVLDEATSALDSESERAIHEALHELMAKKTVIAIAHRLSTIMEMDRIVVMEDGAITAQGTHKELLDADGTYAKLWNIQAGGYV